ncbi:Extracellular exo-alpha-(1-_5)-L-arabinofuranosidase ArbA precursor [Planctomycetes bacterium CA13]|uniref:Extracellular exo-alpha-(1->5)-L-arabinofuranosidase ArbA n=1 Tax=Novipirellula herctigrandis TaxID=2527986 RepID=A0A5C5YYS9_9BACT|nr:Extracellular exo-alpha-(1->5)-L-arabinofuranosidase ArbA precursor [Planctomycetes bacterium CA13]
MVNEMFSPLAKWLCFTFVVMLPQTLIAQPFEQTYRNPVIAGDFPDPTVIRVGSDYYACGTSHDFVPAYPLYHSTDLANWRRIGSVFNELPEWVSGSCWAPELFYENGKFFVYYTAKRKSDNVSCIGVAVANDIREGFVDHGVIIEWGKEAIDAFIFEDDQGKKFISWKAYGLNPTREIEILASELSGDGLSLVGDHFSLTRHDKGWKGAGDEGQCILKHGDYYYHFYSVGGCCDNRCDYNIRVARTKDLHGDWEQYEAGSILHGGGLWKCSGHGTMVTTPDGRFFYLYHAYHRYDFEYVGRQGMLDELLWDDASGWPYFRYGPIPTVQAPVPLRNTQQLRRSLFRDDFESVENLIPWQWDVGLSKPVISQQAGQLGLQNQNNGLTFLGVDTRVGNYSVETTMVDATGGFNGLCVYANPENLIMWGVEDQQIKLKSIRRGEAEETVCGSIDTNQKVHLKFQAVNARLFSFFWSTDGANWNRFPEGVEHVDASDLPPWTRSIRVGFVQEGLDSLASFEYFMVSDQ